MYWYNENIWVDDMEWGVVEFFKFIGEDYFFKDVIYYVYLIEDDGWMVWDMMMYYELYFFMNMGYYSLYEVVLELVC